MRKFDARKCCCQLLGFFTVVIGLVPGAFAADVIESLWQIQSSTELRLDADQIESSTSRAAVSIAPSSIGGLAIGSVLSLDLPSGESVNYTLTEVQKFLNGDWGWQAILADDPFNSRYAMSLTVSENNILAMVYSPVGKYELRASKSASGQGEYSGWLSSSQGKIVLPADEGGYQTGDGNQSPGFDSQAALSGGDVTITQTLSNSMPTIGDEIDVAINVINNLATPISSELLTVFFALDDTEFVNADSICTPNGVPTTQGIQQTLRCNLPTIDAGANVTVSFRVRTTADTFPFFSSSAIVGDPFGENARDNVSIAVIRNTTVDSDSDGISDFNENILGTDPQNNTSVVADSFVAEVDLMFLYTQRFLDDIGSVTPESQINQIVQITNNIYSSSGANVSFRPVFYGLTGHDFNGNIVNTQTLLTNGSGPDFSSVPATQEAVGADIVVVMDGFISNGSACGLGTVPGVGFNGDIFHPIFGGASVYVSMFLIGSAEGSNILCADSVLAHELGHNFGLGHSLRDSNSEGTFPWSHGHGVDGEFVTVMASTSNYPGSEGVELFSNPLVNNCNGMSCGVPQGESLQADAVDSINLTRFQMANINDSNVLAAASLSGASTNAIIYGGASISSDRSTPVSSFSSQDSIDVRATIAIPSEHQGDVGQGHIIISVDGLGFFQRDPAGAYVNWDGSLGSLTGNFSARALQPLEELIAFENFVPAAIGVTSASLTVFFVYTVENTDVLVFSASGVPFSIVP